MKDLYQVAFPIFDYLEKNRGKQITVEIRNEAWRICQSIISQVVLFERQKLKTPLDTERIPTRLDERNIRPTIRVYKPCVICKETRITHDCHIVPRSEGGVLTEQNIIELCPLHHHLFDNHRLNREEWQILITEIEKKSETAILYTNEIHLKFQEKFWGVP